MEDKRLHLIRLLYQEALVNGIAPDKDPELAVEWQALQEVKRWLDAQPRRRPDPVIINRIVAAAVRLGATDRPARKMLRRRRRGMVVLALLVMIGGLWYGLKTTELPDRPGVVVAEQAPTTPEPIEMQPWLRLIAQAEAAAQARSPRAPILQWDDRAAMQQIYRQLQLLEARSVSSWSPALPLEAWPTDGSRPGLVPASRRNE